EDHGLAGAHEEAELLRTYGHDVELLDGPAMRAEVASPTYAGGLWDRTGAGVLHPGRLAAGLAEAAGRAGVVLHEDSAAVALEPSGAGMRVRTAGGEVRAR